MPNVNDPAVAVSVNEKKLQHCVSATVSSATDDAIDGVGSSVNSKCCGPTRSVSRTADLNSSSNAAVLKG